MKTKVFVNDTVRINGFNHSNINQWNGNKVMTGCITGKVTKVVGTIVTVKIGAIRNVTTKRCMVELLNREDIKN